ncbi:hypothetical protein DPMN_117298 [Dreissena polymorpha]|uniref:Uncharacterized protein n=1 Tax=Dreissena polymorpha TaxID=45954 RepID=A0A9D4QV27_DREPO|nr:hypothetical protein DPMN_117298 [Dreissena polymorpha]
MADIAYKAYLKAATPSNIVSAFKKTGIFPLNIDAINKNKLFPCEAFRDKNPFEKLKAVKSGKESVDAYIKDMYIEKQVNLLKSCECSSFYKARPSASKRPKSSGTRNGAAETDAYPNAACLTQGRPRVGNGAMHS